VAFADLVEPASLILLAIAEPIKSPAPITAAVASRFANAALLASFSRIRPELIRALGSDPDLRGAEGSGRRFSGGGRSFSIAALWPRAGLASPSVDFVITGRQ
jgi:hypothetical protein